MRKFRAWRVVMNGSLKIADAILDFRANRPALHRQTGEPVGFVDVEGNVIFNNGPQAMELRAAFFELPLEPGSSCFIEEGRIVKRSRAKRAVKIVAGYQKGMHFVPERILPHMNTDEEKACRSCGGGGDAYGVRCKACEGSGLKKKFRAEE